MKQLCEETKGGVTYADRKHKKSSRISNNFTYNNKYGCRDTNKSISIL